MTFWTLYDRLQSQFANTAKQMFVGAERLTVVQLQNVFDHQRWLATDGRFGQRLVINKRNFESVDLDAVDLSHAEFTGVSFAYSDLRYARFVGAKFDRVSFFACDVEGCDFTDANFTDVVWDQVVNRDRAILDGNPSLPIKATKPEI